jgi:hypothetical protein
VEPRHVCFGEQSGHRDFRGPCLLLTQSGHSPLDIAVPHNTTQSQPYARVPSSIRGASMRRREFISLIGGAAVWPHAVRAQQPMPVIGFMSARSPEDSVAVLAAFRRGLGEGGLIEGKNVEIQFRWARGDFNRLPALAAELVNQRVAVLCRSAASLRRWRRRPRPRPYR